MRPDRVAIVPERPRGVQAQSTSPHASSIATGCQSLTLKTFNDGIETSPLALDLLQQGRPGLAVAAALTCPGQAGDENARYESLRRWHVYGRDDGLHLAPHPDGCMRCLRSSFKLMSCTC